MNTTSASTAAPGQPPRALLRDPAFRRVWLGSAVTMLGDQFTLVALPWLVLKMTGDPLALGLTILLMTVPRALLLLAGGALADRYTPKAMLLLARIASAVLLGLLAAETLAGQVNLGLVQALALLIGTAQALALPAATSLLPRVVPLEQLRTANGLIMGMQQAALLAGPLLAGALLASTDRLHGPGVAFAIDAVSFVFAAWLLAGVRPQPRPRQAGPLLAAVAAGLRTVLGDRVLRACFLYWSLIAFIITGTAQVALPVMAGDRLGGAGALGLLLGAHGAGTLVGIVLSGRAVRATGLPFGALLLAIDALAGLLLIPLGLIGAVWQGAALLAAIGALGGVMQVTVFTWIQRRVPFAMLGRAMGLFMFVFLGLGPLSAGLAGWLLRWLTPAQLLAGSGALLVLTALAAALLTSIRSIGHDAAAEAA